MSLGWAGLKYDIVDSGLVLLSFCLDGLLDWTAWLAARTCHGVRWARVYQQSAIAIMHACCTQVSDRELYDKIVASAQPGSGHAAFVAERAELLLQVPARLGLMTRCVFVCDGRCVPTWVRKQHTCTEDSAPQASECLAGWGATMC